MRSGSSPPQAAGYFQLAKELFGSTFVLCGLRHDPDRTAAFYRRLGMLLEASTTYQWILNKGRVQGAEQGRQEGMQQGMQQGAAEEARRWLLQGRKRFCASPTSEAVVQTITDTPRLERMAERIFDATGWDDLLATA